MNHNQEENSTDEVQKQSFPDSQIQTFLGEMRRLMKVENKQFHERLDKLEMDYRRQRNSPRPPPRRMRQREGRGDGKEVGDREDNNLGSVKTKITPFQGWANPETYLE